ncbi:MAG: DUF167 domain-containing protein [Actinomycetota bacterium]
MGSRVVKVRAVPRSRRPGVEECPDGSLRVSVPGAPEKGRANKQVVQYVAEHLGVPRGSVSIMSGQGSRDKVLRIEE